MRSNALWLLAILGIIGVMTWASSVKRVLPLPERLIPRFEVPPRSGMLVADKGYAEVSKLANPYSGDPNAAEQGKLLFQANCTSCHGPGALGDGAAGMALDPKPSDLTRIQNYSHGAGDSGIFRTVKYGIAFTGMAPWEGRMTDDETWKVSQYVRCLQRDR